jgi:hypothetical protein
MTSLLVHTALYNGKEIWLRAKLAREQEDDVHMRLMKKYRVGFIVSHAKQGC